MTTDQLVNEILEMLKRNEFDGKYMKHMREVEYGFTQTGMVYSVYSVALNDETRDVRYIEQRVQPIENENPLVIVCEVRPETIVKTVYRAVDGGYYGS